MGPFRNVLYTVCKWILGLCHDHGLVRNIRDYVKGGSKLCSSPRTWSSQTLMNGWYWTSSVETRCISSAGLFAKRSETFTHRVAKTAFLGNRTPPWVHRRRLRLIQCSPPSPSPLHKRIRLCAGSGRLAYDSRSPPWALEKLGQQAVQCTLCNIMGLAIRLVWLAIRLV